MDKNRTGLSYDMIFLHGKKEDYNAKVSMGLRHQPCGLPSLTCSCPSLLLLRGCVCQNTYVTVQDLGYSMRKQGKLHELIQVCPALHWREEGLYVGIGLDSPPCWLLVLWCGSRRSCRRP